MVYLFRSNVAVFLSLTTRHTKGEQTLRSFSVYSCDESYRYDRSISLFELSDLTNYLVIQVLN